MKKPNKSMESKKTLGRIPLPKQAEKAFKDKNKYARKEEKKISFEEHYYDELVEELIVEVKEFVTSYKNGGENVDIFDTTHSRERKDERAVNMDEAIRVIQQIIPVRWNDINNDKTLNDKEFFTVETETGITIYGRLNIAKIYNGSTRDVQISTMSKDEKPYYIRNPQAKISVPGNQFVIITLMQDKKVGIDNNTNLNYIITGGKVKRKDNRLTSQAAAKNVKKFMSGGKFR